MSQSKSWQRADGTYQEGGRQALAEGVFECERDYGEQPGSGEHPKTQVLGLAFSMQDRPRFRPATAQHAGGWTAGALTSLFFDLYSLEDVFRSEVVCSDQFLGHSTAGGEWIWKG